MIPFLEKSILSMDITYFHFIPAVTDPPKPKTRKIVLIQRSKEYPLRGKSLRRICHQILHNAVQKINIPGTGPLYDIPQYNRVIQILQKRTELALPMHGKPLRHTAPVHIFYKIIFIRRLNFSHLTCFLKREWHYPECNISPGKN